MDFVSRMGLIGFSLQFTSNPFKNQPIRLPGLKPGVRSGLILSGAFYPDLKIRVWRRRTYQFFISLTFPLING
jgi:hypothetical protein